jgi:S-adenosylmethionine hydrolase
MATVTLTTDFGDGTAYVAALKGSVLAVNPNARLLDLSHRLPPQDLAAAAYFLASSLRWFPAGTIHVVVVDPGVGTQRAILCVEWAGQMAVVPDNGCWTSILQPGEIPQVRRVENRRYWRPTVSATFHGRDVFAPVAGHLSLGVSPAELGPEVKEWTTLSMPEPVAMAGGIAGQIIVVDSFGNLVSNIPGEGVPPAAAVQVGGETVVRRVRTYGDAEPGALVALIGSSGRLEIAVVNGSAAVRLGVEVGEPVEVVRNP